MRGRLLLLALLANVAACAGQAAPPPAITLDTSVSAAGVIDVTGVPAGTLQVLKRSELSQDGWAAILRVSVRPSGASQASDAPPAMLGKYTVENVVTKIEPGAVFEWGVGIPGSGPLGHVYGYELADAGDGATDVTSYCDWSGIGDDLRNAIRWPVVPKMALISTLEKLDRLATNTNG